MNDQTTAGPDGPLIHPVLRFDALCDRFEAAWRAGRRPRIEDYLGECPEPGREEVLRELLAVEVELRREAGGAPTPDDYRDRFPARESLIAAAFAGPSSRSGPSPADDLDTPPTAVDPPSVEAIAAVGPRGSSAVGGRYRKLRPHARGGLGEVSLAFDEELHREVALKEIRAGRADDATSRARFALEAEITGGLMHPGIVPVYSLGRHGDGRLFYAMRFVEGDTLQQAIARFHEADGPARDSGARALALRGLLGRFLDICNAVAYAHSRGVLHRDIKPQNVMLGEFGETLVVDWGLAKVLDRAGGDGASAADRPFRPPSAGSTPTEDGAQVGTPQYMSPEQAAGDLDRHGPRSDVYSLGATLYCLLTGRPPFAGHDAESTLAAVRAGDYPPPRRVDPTIAPALEAICRKAMALRPDDRYESPRALAADVERWLGDEPVSAHREPIADRARRWMRRHRTLVASGAVALVVALVGTAGVAALQTTHAHELDTINGKLRNSNERVTRANTSLRQAGERERLANTSLRAALDNERTARKSAQDRFALAMGAIKVLHAGVADDVILLRPDLKELRDKLLRGALDRYRQLADSLRGADASDPASRTALASAYFQVGELTREVGSPDDAIRAFRESLAVRTALMRDQPTVSDHRYEMARSHNRIGALLLRTGRPDAALEAFREELRLQEALARDHPGDSIHRSNAAATLLNIGGLLAETGRFDQALRAFREARTQAEGLVRDRPDDLTHRFNLAASNGHLGMLLRQTGRPDDALRAIGEARRLFEALAREHPDHPEYRARLASSRLNIGALLDDLGRPDDALREYGEVVLLFNALVRDQPTVQEHRRGLALARKDLGNILRSKGRVAEARASLLESRTLLEGLVGDNPAVHIYRYELSRVQHSLGILDREARRPDDALREYTEALNLREQLAREDPAFPAYRHGLARIHIDIGLLLHDLGRPDDALRDDDEALRLLEPLARDHPDVPGYRSGLALVHHNIGVLLMTTRPEDARDSFRRAIEQHRVALDGAPGVIEFRRFLSGHYQHLLRVELALGRPAAAAEAARERRKLWPGNAAEQYNAACEFALCAAPAGLGGEERSRYANEAMDALRAAVASGWRDGAHTLRDADLDALRDRPDFRRLLDDLLDRAFPADPFAR
ncbi:MAG TPA: serine/threonine-protein kinase [Isosphaeraceae bacterium]|nr:serine/threonine-protein kinase [Isosphaeraceae bacterium]